MTYASAYKHTHTVKVISLPKVNFTQIINLHYLLGTTIVVESRTEFVIVLQLIVAPFKAVSDIRLPSKVRRDLTQAELPVVFTIIPTPLTVNDGITGIEPGDTRMLPVNKELVQDTTLASSLQV